MGAQENPNKMEGRVNHQTNKERKCKNWRSITLLSVVGKVLARILIERIRCGIDCWLRKEQAAYRKGTGTTEQVSFHIAKYL